MVTTAIPGPVETQLRAIFAQDKAADFIALVWPTAIDPSTCEINIAETTLTIVYCESELAIREQLVLHDNSSKRLVILSAFDETHLSKDVLARLWGFEPKRISPWRTLEQLLGVIQIDPRLTHKKYRWIAECLVSTYDRYHDHIRFTETLDFDKAWEAISLGFLGYKSPSLDLDSLFEWSIEKGVSDRVSDLPEGVSEHIDDWFKPRLGDLTPLVKTLWSSGHAQDMLAIGLACNLLYGDKQSKARSSAVLEARGQFTERFLGGNKFNKDLLKRYGNSAKLFAERFTISNKRLLSGVFTQAEKDLASLGLNALTVESDLLPAAFSLRLDGFAVALEQSIKGKSMEPTLSALESLQRHQLADVRHNQVSAAELAVRMCLWLQRDPDKSESAHAIISDYVAEGGFLDWARSKIWAGDEHEQVSLVYQKLTKKSAEHRDGLNKRFSEYLPGVARGDQIGEGIWPVESALDGLIAPLAKQQPILLLVIDGMSQAVYRELSQDLMRRRWVELQRDGHDGAECLLSALPSITKASRYSLFAGKLGVGVAADEKKAFSSHAGLKNASPKSSPVLFHKSDLEQTGTGGLSGNVREIIAGDKHRVVAAVVNTVDDQLSSNAQLSVNWNVEALVPLNQLLEAAREAGRLVVFTSDHGHVLDHDMSYRKESNERYKQNDEKVMSGEILLEGKRVIETDNRAIFPWTEKVRYTSKKRGYHGGASLQELIIPFGVFSNIDDKNASDSNNTLNGWHEVSRQIPSWWNLNDDHVYLSASEGLVFPETSPVSNSKSAKKDKLTLDLFEPTQELSDNTISDNVDWVSAFLTSPIYKQMKSRMVRVSLSEEQLIVFLRFLNEREGQQMLAAVADVLEYHVLRINGLLSNLQKLFNVDGYPVLSIDRSSKTVKLDIELLRKQFEI